MTGVFALVRSVVIRQRIPVTCFTHFRLKSRALMTAAALGGCVAAPAAWATIVGLNQIVTPDIQPAGVLALSAQVQHPSIGNSQQIQFELGLTPRFELSWFQGLKPGEGLFSTELNLLQQGPHLLTAGAINWSTRDGAAQPVVEYGYYRGPITSSLAPFTPTITPTCC